MIAKNKMFIVLRSVLVITIVVLVFLNYNEYSLRNDYSEFTKRNFLSYTHYGGFKSAPRHISSAENRYADILNNEYVSKYDAYGIHRIMDDFILDFVPTRLKDGVVLGVIEPLKGEIITKTTMEEIGAFFHLMLDEQWYVYSFQYKDVLKVLDDDLRTKIEYLAELNDMWVNSIERNIDWLEYNIRTIEDRDANGNVYERAFSGFSSIDEMKEKYLGDDWRFIEAQIKWANAALDIEKNTREFLDSHGVETISELLE
ncbi:hypothetical protein RBH29_16900 [Herbivorax sp. ANBcel31]|uniref:hypothetical protein n=1 Tax=Herbivorax sp. ANBcel31 TaxID=3069754 RepID=UPI0027AFF589|nr:hypothetical protein [Herbivorax sp. ANBcel31]MDQ2088107.1 hypothetical protein [Herbivorax sp. ANBcel31]